MRCKECDVDLAEEYTICPLCGEKACDDEAVLKNIKTAPYPKYEEPASKVKDKSKPLCETVCKHITRILLVLCAMLLLLSFFTAKALGTVAAPSVLIFAAVFCFVCALKEKGRLLHCAVNLLSVFLFSLIFCLIAHLTKISLSVFWAAAILSAILLLLLAVIKPERAKQQLCAIFRL